ncbi:ABC transporter permease, partial [Candidatus Bipolaricaulota bacterium]|nr:ABC transporter permease [Candidatus Bipolaricaulota bacterium]
YPVETLPGWLQVVSSASPATYVIEGMRGCLLRGQSTHSLLPIVFILIGAGTVVIGVGLFIFGRVERYAKRTGRLKRSG